MRKHARVIPLLALVAAPLAIAAGGCEAPDGNPDAGNGPQGEASQPIVNGSLDTVNDAVCALTIAQGDSLAPFCTTTIIARDGSIGYALSAAHCVEDLGSNAPLYLLCTDAYDDCPSGACQVYEVTHYEAHPQYTGDVPHDVAMLTFTGATSATPIIPVAGASDGVGDGDSVEVSGYGLIDGYNQTGSDARRHAFSVTDGDFSDAFVVPQSYDGPYGGACNGDSGGPLMAGSGASKRVVGVVSQGDQYCAEVGYYARVSYEYAFIAQYMDEPVPEETCDQCVQGSVSGGQCTSTWDACTNDADCNALLTCFNGCTTDACYDDCASQYPGGIAGYNAIVTCAYCDACDATCNESFCDDPSSSSSGPTGSGPTGSGVGATTGSGDTTGVGPGVTTGTGDTTAVGAGGATGAGGASSDDDDDDDDSKDGDDGGDNASGEGTSCTVAAVGAPAGGAGWLVAAAALALGASRRRRH